MTIQECFEDFIDELESTYGIEIGDNGVSWYVEEEDRDLVIKECKATMNAEETSSLRWVCANILYTRAKYDEEVTLADLIDPDFYGNDDSWANQMLEQEKVYG